MLMIRSGHGWHVSGLLRKCSRQMNSGGATKHFAIVFWRHSRIPGLMQLSRNMSLATQAYVVGIRLEIVIIIFSYLQSHDSNDDETSGVGFCKLGLQDGIRTQTVAARH